MKAEASARVADVGFRLPPEAWDCHVHIFDQRYPYVPKRKYTPADALPTDLAAMLDRVGLSRALIVQPSPYGTDNRCTLEAVRASCGRYLAVAVIGSETGKDAIGNLHRIGIRGIRLNFAGLAAIEPFRAQLRHIEDLVPELTERGWHVETHLPPNLLEEVIESTVLGDVPLVIDHFGLSGVPPNVFRPTLERLRRGLGRGSVWIKLSAPYRLGEGEIGFERAARATELYLATNPERLLWASDWPHTPPHPEVAAVERVIPFRNIDPANLLRFLGQTVPRREDLVRILSENPRRLLCQTLAGQPVNQ